MTFLEKDFSTSSLILAVLDQGFPVVLDELDQIFIRSSGLQARDPHELVEIIRHQLLCGLLAVALGCTVAQLSRAMGLALSASNQGQSRNEKMGKRV